MPNKKSKTKYKLLIKIDVPKILREYLEKGPPTEEDIEKHIKVREFTVINGTSLDKKGETPPEV